MRLIDADNFQKELSNVWKWLIERDKKGYGATHGECLDKIHDILINQPTAYDVDKVIEQVVNVKLPLASQKARIIGYIKAGGID